MIDKPLLALLRQLSFDECAEVMRLMVKRMAAILRYRRSAQSLFDKDIDRIVQRETNQADKRPM